MTRSVFARSRALRAGVFAALVVLGACSPAAPDLTINATDLVVGTGTVATVGRVVTVTYTGWLQDKSKPDNKGTVFATTNGTFPLTFQLGFGAVIAGLDQSIPGMAVGGTRRMTIPPALAYGSAGSPDGSVPPNTYVIFEVTLVSVQ